MTLYELVMTWRGQVIFKALQHFSRHVQALNSAVNRHVSLTFYIFFCCLSSSTSPKNVPLPFHNHQSQQRKYSHSYLNKKSNDSCHSQHRNLTLAVQFITKWSAYARTQTLTKRLTRGDSNLWPVNEIEFQGAAWPRFSILSLSLTNGNQLTHSSKITRLRWRAIYIL